ncbi:MAG: hypothetical protein EA399_14515 [Desulfovibrionales bacterium]|nr:MAG: hypothetical protein EA399_14515 [Desulfovibrionales bacterium]
MLARGFLDQYSALMGKAIHDFAPRAMEILKQYPFPRTEKRRATGRYLLRRPQHPARSPAPSVQGRRRPPGFKARPVVDGHGRERRTPAFPDPQAEQHYIRHVLDTVNGNKRRAAAILGIHRRTLYRKLEQG